MTIESPELRSHFEKAKAALISSPPDQVLIAALLDAHHWFTLINGSDATPAVEALQHLLSDELRPSVRQWYKSFGNDMNPNAIEFREHLSALAGEKFG